MNRRFSSPEYPVGDGPLRLVRADRFVVRHLALAPEADVAEQVELAVEALAPLPLAQLYWGYLADARREEALVWIACRKQFDATEVADWEQASVVLPASLFVMQAARHQGGTILHSEADFVQAVVGAPEPGGLPRLLLARAASPTVETELLAECARRNGGASSTVTRLAGAAAVRRLSQGGLAWSVGEMSAQLAWSELVTADLRDRDELAFLRRVQRRSRWLWRATLAAAAIAVAAAGLDAVRVAAGWGAGRLEARMRTRAVTVAAIQDSHALTHRLGQLAEQRLQFLEMIALLNEHRPSGLRFTRVVSQGPRSLEVTARTANADEARQFEAAMRADPALLTFSVGNLQARDGHTDFTVLAEFRPGPVTIDPGMP